MIIKSEDSIKKKAQELGFLSCGIATANELPEFRAQLNKYLAEKRNADLAYMANNQEKRTDPRKLVDNCKSIISVTLNYYNPSIQHDSKAPIVSKYAYGKDYHTVVKDKLYQLLQFINNDIAPCQGRAFVDSAPVADKLWAQRAGLGWIGKNTLLITPVHGSFVFIGELLVDLELEADKPFENSYCGSCTLCIDACPTKALISAGKLNARRCISYQTTANKNDGIDSELQGKFRNRVFGCDICQDICPWNNKASMHNTPEFIPSTKLLELDVETWKSIDEEQFREIFRHSTIKLIKHKGLQRNIRFLDL
ncbi:MAG: tRNA epoxyqueuosine(34) reductase QueG [Mangrovibacterium sp.]